MFGLSYTVVIEIYIGNQLVQSQQMTAPRPFLEMQFLRLIQEIQQQSQPMKVIMKRKEIIWDNFEQIQKEVEYNIVAQNWEEK